MKTIKVIIERSNDLFTAYAENIEGIYGGGTTVVEAKKSILKSIQLLIKYNKQLPSMLRGKYTIVYHFDTQSFLNYYKGIFTNAALERITGINQKQFHHYATGLKKPRTQQSKKIETALHLLGHELLAIEL